MSLSSSNSYNNTKLSGLMQRIFSFNGNLMLAAIISLLLVILFVLLLHIYAKWFLDLRLRRRRTSSSSPQSQPQPQPPDVQTLSSFSSPNPKGLHSSIIASIPLFVYQSRDSTPGELSDCVICLSEFEEDEAGRELPRCGHRFHLECIDMWLHSHTNCPICRAPVVASDKKKKKKRKRKLPAVAEEDSTADRGIESATSGISRPEQIRGAIGSSQTNPSLEIVIECDSGGVRQVEISEEQAVMAQYEASSSSMLGSSLKRMLSRPDSSKIHPSIISADEC